MGGASTLSKFRISHNGVHDARALREALDARREAGRQAVNNVKTAWQKLAEGMDSMVDSVGQFAERVGMTDKQVEELAKSTSSRVVMRSDTTNSPGPTSLSKSKKLLGSHLTNGLVDEIQDFS